MFLINVGSEKCVISLRFPLFFLSSAPPPRFILSPKGWVEGGQHDQMGKIPVAVRPAWILCPEKKRKIAAHRVQEIKFILRDRRIKYGCFTFGFML